MFYHLLYSLKEYCTFFNVFQYITVRSALTAVTALGISFFLYPYFIKFLKKIQLVEKINKEHKGLYDIHKKKEHTPTMGGIVINISIIISVLFWADLSNTYIQLGLFSLIWLGAIGFIDDYIKCVKKTSKGLSAKKKFLWQFIFCSIVCALLYFKNPESQFIIVPFLKNVVIPMGVLYLFLILFIVIGSSNAVNLTDGLDGLAIGCIIISSLAYAVLAYVAGHVTFCAYLSLPFVNGAGELMVFCTSIIGAGLGFLWFNSYPAKIFMGDTGALPLGGILGMIAIMIKQEALLAIIGGVFVIEAMSVIIQVFYFKLTGKRFFLIAPLHHHFEMKGVHEAKIVVRFWILAVILAVAALCTLKIR